MPVKCLLTLVEGSSQPTLVSAHHADLLAAALANAANSSLSPQHREGENEDGSTAPSSIDEEAALVQIFVQPGFSEKKSNVERKEGSDGVVMNQPPLPTAWLWSRRARDDVRRLVDLAAQRVVPPLDARQYATKDRIQFCSHPGPVLHSARSREADGAEESGKTNVDTQLLVATIRVLADDENDCSPGCRRVAMYDASDSSAGDEAMTIRGRVSSDRKRWRLAGLLVASLYTDHWYVSGQPRAGAAPVRDCVSAVVARNSGRHHHHSPSAAPRHAPPVVHVEPRGVAVTLAIVASTSTHAILAARVPAASSSRKEDCWRTVGAIPVPAELLHSGAKEARRRVATAVAASVADAAGQRKRPRGAEEEVDGQLRAVASPFHSTEQRQGDGEDLEWTAAVAHHRNRSSTAAMTILPASARRVVEAVAFRLVVESPDELRGTMRADEVDISVEDIAVKRLMPLGLGGEDDTGSSSLAASCHTVDDLAALARESSRQILARLDSIMSQRKPKQHHSPLSASGLSAVAGDGGGGEGAQDDESARRKKRKSDGCDDFTSRQVAEFLKLRESLLDTMSVAFPKARGGGGGAVALPKPLLGPQSATPVTSPFIIADDESNELEFKYAVAGEDRKDSSSMTAERLRRTMAAMASTAGGIIIVGIQDDGSLAQRADLVSAASRIRCGGFCPAMVTGAVSVAEQPLRFLDAPQSLPKEWWKGAIGNSSGGDNTLKTTVPGSLKSTPATTSVSDGFRRDVLTVVTVRRGTAPFYAPHRHGVPSMRGAASTVTMPVRVMVSRLARLLPATQEDD